jgi:hypothetical protein
VAVNCAAITPAPVLLACVREHGAPVAPEADMSLAVPMAQVTGESFGALEGGCLDPLLEYETNRAALSAQATSWTVTDGGRAWDVEFVVEGNEVPNLMGQSVSLSYSYQYGEFSPTLRHLSMTTLSSPSHGLWIAEAGDLPDFGELPLLLSRGPVACSSCDDCGGYEGYEISASDPLSMETVHLEHARSGVLGPYIIVHGGYRQQTSTTSPCSDWFVADVHVAILGRM